MAYADDEGGRAPCLSRAVKVFTEERDGKVFVTVEVDPLVALQELPAILAARQAQPAKPPAKKRAARAAKPQAAKKEPETKKETAATAKSADLTPDMFPPPEKTEKHGKAVVTKPGQTVAEAKKEHEAAGAKA